MKVNKLIQQINAGYQENDLLTALIILGCKYPILSRLGMVPGLTDRVVSKFISNVLIKAYGDPKIFPRVHAKRSNNSTFVKSPEDRYHASLIYSISKRFDLVEKVTSNTYVEALIAVYQQYLDITGQQAPEALLSFNDMFEIINGVVVGDVCVVHCKNCSAKTVFNIKNSKPGCISCQVHMHPAFDTKYIERQKLHA